MKYNDDLFHDSEYALPDNNDTTVVSSGPLLLHKWTYHGPNGKSTVSKTESKTKLI